MTRWQGILAQLFLYGAGVVATSQLKDHPKPAAAVLAGIAVAKSLVSNETSRSNPDGTDAKTAWLPKG